MVDVMQTVVLICTILLLVAHVSIDHGKGGSGGNYAVQTV